MNGLRLVLCAMLLYGGLVEANAATEADVNEVQYYMELPEVFAEVPELPAGVAASDAGESVYLNALAKVRMDAMIQELQYRIEEQFNAKAD